MNQEPFVSGKYFNIRANRVCPKTRSLSVPHSTVQGKGSYFSSARDTAAKRALRDSSELVDGVPKVKLVLVLVGYGVGLAVDVGGVVDDGVWSSAVLSWSSLPGLAVSAPMLREPHFLLRRDSLLLVSEESPLLSSLIKIGNRGSSKDDPDVAPWGRMISAPYPRESPSVSRRDSLVLVLEKYPFLSSLIKAGNGGSSA